MRELTYARRLNKPVLPVAIQEISDDLPAVLKDLQVLRVDTSETLGVAALVGAVSRLSAIAPQLPEPLPHRPRPPGSPDTEQFGPIFVAGSESDGCIRPYASDLGDALASLDVRLESLSGAAGKAVGFAMGDALKKLGRYEPDRIHFVYRARDKASVPMERRIGVVVNSEIADKDALRVTLLRRAVAAIGIAGGTQSLRELELAVETGIPVIPIAASGGAAATAWSGIVRGKWIVEPHELYLLPAFQKLADADRAVATAIELVSRVIEGI